MERRMSDEELLALAKQTGLLTSLSDQAYDSLMSGDYKILRQFAQRIIEFQTKVGRPERND
ncbi:MAG: hypothetical protein EBT36_11275 [Betaproteobacteria bacterium]|jgi:hypothetical protein|nr:hypothetical protein [Betaproteobacteria bacterium]NBP34440.1 hypothetical protein [Betaproteobacteria bacterium]NBP38119.1 hypothetical protein [Betaproteobacteria bacterium]NBQ78305.1 hypothetical protein [Betaproteobacteria bacterium]NBQ94827.1 hypothetical protein [Betaproteobacteria bacterium]